MGRELLLVLLTAALALGLGLRAGWGRPVEPIWGEPLPPAPTVFVSR